MIYIALTLVATPISVMLFFAIYKIVLIIKNKQKEKTQNISQNPNHDHQNITTENSDEITAVITAAVFYYSPQWRGQRVVTNIQACTGK